MYLNERQRKTLLRPINPQRVLSLKRGSSGPTLSYVAQHDIRAHLNRVFGFGRWSMRVISTDFVFEHQDKNNRWVACYRATVGIDIQAPDGTHLATYEDSHASGNAPQPDRAEAHALALTIAVSTAMKRAASCLGDQFGLSLYNKGQTSPFVIATILDGDMVEEAPVTSLGDEMSDKTVTDDDTPAQEPLKIEHSAEFTEFLTALRDYTKVEDTAARLNLLIAAKKTASKNGWTDDTIVNESGMTLGKVFDIVSKGGQ